MNRIIEAIGNGLKWLYKKGKAGLKTAFEWLKAKLPIKKSWFEHAYQALWRLLKGATYGCYYGLKDGYHAYRQHYGKEKPEDYYFLTTIEFKDE